MKAIRHLELPDSVSLNCVMNQDSSRLSQSDPIGNRKSLFSENFKCPSRAPSTPSVKSFHQIRTIGYASFIKLRNPLILKSESSAFKD